MPAVGCAGRNVSADAGFSGTWKRRMNQEISRIAQIALDGGDVGRDDAVVLAEASGADVYDVLYWANRIRERYCGDEIHLCSVVNARSGACSEDCGFCAQSAHCEADTDVYPMMSAERIKAAAREAEGFSANNFGIVTSGCDPGSTGDFDTIREVVESLARGDMKVCASLGRLTVEEAIELKAAGIRRLHHNLETSRAFFPNVCTTHTYDDRVETIKAVKAAGLRVCSGGIMGLGEGWSDRIDMALDLRELDVDSIPVNFLNPVVGTAFEHNEPLPPMECLKIIALYRFILPTKLIKTAGGRERNLRDMQSWMYYAGANGTLIGNYLTTIGRSPEDDLRLIADLGLRVAQGGGDHCEPCS